MLRTVITACIAVMLMNSFAIAQPLGNREIHASVSGARFVGINKFGSPYTYRFRSNGSMRGVLGKKDQFDDRGRWWVKADQLCMHWELWSFGKPNCFAIDLVGDQVSRLKEDGSIHQQSTLKR